MRPDLHDEFCITVHKLHQLSLITMRGEIDLANVHLLAGAVEHLGRREVPLLFDLTQVRYIDSTGLHFLRQAQEQCARQHVPFAVVTNAVVRRLCGLLSLEALIPIFQDATSARDHIFAEWGSRPSNAAVPS